jgi:hypothetical protein
MPTQKLSSRRTTAPTHSEAKDDSFGGSGMAETITKATDAAPMTSGTANKMPTMGTPRHVSGAYLPKGPGRITRA